MTSPGVGLRAGVAVGGAGVVVGPPGVGERASVAVGTTRVVGLAGGPPAVGLGIR